MLGLGRGLPKLFGSSFPRTIYWVVWKERNQHIFVGTELSQDHIMGDWFSVFPGFVEAN